MNMIKKLLEDLRITIGNIEKRFSLTVDPSGAWYVKYSELPEDLDKRFIFYFTPNWNNIDGIAFSIFSVAENRDIHDEVIPFYFIGDLKVDADLYIEAVHSRLPVCKRVMDQFYAEKHRAEEEAFKEALKEMEERIVRNVDEKLDEVEDHEQRISTLEESVGNMEDSNIDDLKESVRELENNQFEDPTEKIEDLAGRLVNLEEEVEEIKEMVPIATIIKKIVDELIAKKLAEKKDGE